LQCSQTTDVIGLQLVVSDIVLTVPSVVCEHCKIALQKSLSR
jgi:hypothetical protein